MSKFLDLDEAESFSPTIAFRKQQAKQLNNLSHNNDVSRIIPKSTAKVLDSKSTLPTLQKTNDSNNSASMHIYLKQHEKSLQEQQQQQIPTNALVRHGIQSRIPSRLKSPVGSLSNTEKTGPNSSTTLVPRLNNISSNSLNKKLTFPRSRKVSTYQPTEPLQITNGSNLQPQPQPQKLKFKAQSALDTNTFSPSTSVPTSIIKSTSLPKSINLGFIDLTSEDEDNDVVNTNNANPSISSFDSKHFSTSNIQNPSFPTPVVERTAHLNTQVPFNKFFYNDDIDNKNRFDSDSDSGSDEIIITGVNQNADQSFNNLTINQPANTLITSSNIVPKNGPKRILADNTLHDMMKRQKILDNKREFVLNQLKKQESIENQMEMKAELERERNETIRVNKLLEKYAPIKGLPEKYQVQFPKSSDFIIDIEPVLPNYITELELRQERIANLPHQFRAEVFREDNLRSMHSVVHRINKFSDLYSRMDMFLKSVSILRNQIQEKAKNTRGLIKADIRYNQILRFIDSHVKVISRYFGEAGMTIDKLNEFKKEILMRSKKCEEIRNILVFKGIANLVNTKLKPVSSYLKSLEETNLIVNSITEIKKFSNNVGAETLATIREFSLTPTPLPPLRLPDVKFEEPGGFKIEDPILNSFDINNPITIDDDDDETDSAIFRSSIPFGRSRDAAMPFSNVYHSNLNDSDGIKNLMESIKVIEFEEEGLANTPKELCISLLKHQRIGLSWMLKSEEGGNKGGILADDMGLGKTVQAISLILANNSKDPKLKTTLIVGPVSLLHQWQQEISMKIHNDKKLSIYLFHANNKVKTFEELAKYDIVLISYQTLGSEWKKHYKKDLEESRKRGASVKPIKAPKHFKSPFFTDNAFFYRIVLDEAQYIKNQATIASKAVASLSSTYRWCLSGTPIQNKIEELYPLIRFLGIKPYNDWQKFSHSIVTSIKHNRSSGHQKIHALLSAILLRRTKDSEVDGKPILTLPEKHFIEEKVEMEKEEKEFYQTLEVQSAKTADKLLSAKQQKNYSSILTLLMRMRQACDHEYLVRLGDDGDRTLRLERFQKGFEALKDYEHSVYNRINVARETGFVCINCNEDLAETQTLLLSKCGHSICMDCHDEYFEDNSESSWEGGKSAKCAECGVLNLSTMSVDLQLFEAYDEGLDWKNIRRRFDLDSKAGDKFWRSETITKFIKDDGKLATSAKINKTLEIISNIQTEKPGEKIIVFSQFMAFFDILKIRLRENDVKFLQYDGSMNLESKNECIKQFYQDSNANVLLLSLKAGNVGLTLTCANHVIIAEPFWNPYVEKQAQDRVHRISQTKEVFIHRLLIDGTIEDRIMDLQKKKEELVESALDPTARSKIGKLSRRELGFLFGLNGLAQLEND